MSAPGRSQARTLKILAGHLKWRGGEAMADRYPAAFTRIELIVDTLEVAGWVQLLGREVTIHARRIVARPADGRMAVIDVSGVPAEPSFDAASPSGRPKGTPAAPDGQAGQDGGAGRPGGRLTIVVDTIDGELGLAANGSAGGDSERGSDGVLPAPTHGAHGAFVPLRDYKGYGRRGKHPGSRVLAPWKQRSADPYVVLAAGVPGGNARRGGHAGAPGRPGNGGDGGRIELFCDGAERLQMVTTASGGQPGQAGPPAVPGSPGPVGQGGKHRLYAVSVGVWGSWVKHEAYAHEGKDRLLAAKARKHRIPTRAPSGAKTHEAGSVPLAPVAQAGRGGQVQVREAASDPPLEPEPERHQKRRHGRMKVR